MVIIDPCQRLNTIQNQLVPGMIKNAHEIAASGATNIRSAIEQNLPELEKNCYELAARCEKKWPKCGEEVELCNEKRIQKLFQDTRDELEHIWKE
ncbi:MAG: hypothetical protein M8349_01110 [ANME-2 cluster archaeon]|nr:hypothetical protein [ANME-2 cluster archaeon]